jgi:hypothetical protein
MRVWDPGHLLCGHDNWGNQLAVVSSRDAGMLAVPSPDCAARTLPGALHDIQGQAFARLE